MRSEKRHALPVFALLLACALPACSKKTPECNGLVEVVNDVDSKVRGSDVKTDEPKAHAAALVAVADAEEKAATSLSKMSLTIPELKKFGQDFNAAFKAHADASRKIAAILGRFPDANAQKAMDTQMASAQEQVDTSLHAITVHCEEKPTDCESFAKLLGEHPDAAGIRPSDPQKAKDWASSAVKWARDIEKASVKDAELKKQLQTLQKGWKELAAVLVKMADAASDEPKMNEAYKNAEKSSQDVGNLIDGLNKFCQGS